MRRMVEMLRASEEQLALLPQPSRWLSSPLTSGTADVDRGRPASGALALRRFSATGSAETSTRARPTNLAYLARRAAVPRRGWGDSVGEPGSRGRALHFADLGVATAHGRSPARSSSAALGRRNLAPRTRHAGP